MDYNPHIGLVPIGHLECLPYIKSVADIPAVLSNHSENTHVPIYQIEPDLTIVCFRLMKEPRPGIKIELCDSTTVRITYPLVYYGNWRSEKCQNEIVDIRIIQLDKAWIINEQRKNFKDYRDRGYKLKDVDKLFNI